MTATASMFDTVLPAPITFAQLTFNEAVTRRLRALAADPASLPHILLYGPPGSGKRTRITALLHALFGNRFQVQRTTLRLKIPPHKKNRGDNVIQATVVASVHHVEIVLDQLEYHNVRDALQAILQYLSSGKHMRSFANTNGDTTTTEDTSPTGFQCVVLYGVDRLPVQAQLALRRSMETLVSYCRFLLTASNTSNVNEALKSRCVCIRNPAPAIPDTRRGAKAPVTQPWRLYSIHLLQLLLDDAAVRRQRKKTTALPFQTVRKGLYELLSRGIPPDALLNALIDACTLPDSGLQIPAHLARDVFVRRLVAFSAEHALDVTSMHEPIYYLESWMRHVHALALSDSLAGPGATICAP